MRTRPIIMMIGLSLLILAISGCGTPPAPPGAPTILSAVAGDGHAALTWTTVTGATSYNVYKSLTAGGPYDAPISASGSPCTVTGLTNNTTYYFVVTAVNSDGESGYSTEASATLPLFDNFDSYAVGNLGAPWVVDSSTSGVPTVAIDAFTASKTAFMEYGSFVSYRAFSAVEDSLVKIRVSWNDYNNAIYGVIARRTDIGTYYQLVIDKSSGKLALGRFIGGAGVILGEYTLGFDDAAYTAYHELKLEVDGTSIKGYLDGVERVSATNTEITGAGYAGLYLLNGSAYFEDFERDVL